jgi:Ca2+-binding RTX toxin-like protein
MMSLRSFVTPAFFPAVQKFFDTSLLADGTYNSTQTVNQLSLGSNDSIKLISQYGLGIYDDDFIERAYIFGSTFFGLNIAGSTFEVSGNGSIKNISNLVVLPISDNFDYDSDDGLAIAANNLLLEPTFDPYNLGNPVNILFSGSGKIYSSYDSTQFQNERTSPDGSANKLEGLASLIVDSAYFFEMKNDAFLSYSRNGRKVIYGTPGNDVVQSLLVQAGGVYLVGGTGFDTINGQAITDDVLTGGEGNDSLTGRGGGDTLIGGQGDDELYGNGDNDLIWADSDINPAISGNDTVYGGAGIDTIYADVAMTLL